MTNFPGRDCMTLKVERRLVSSGVGSQMPGCGTEVRSWGKGTSKNGELGSFDILCMCVYTNMLE